MLREELARRRFDYVAKQVVDEIDTCLYGDKNETAITADKLSDNTLG